MALRGNKLKVANDVTGLIGETPMVRINRLTGPNDSTVYAKLEWFNVGGSVKDRLGLYIFEYAESAAKLSRDKVILEATSGNTGIALAMIAAAKGYRISIVMPEVPPANADPAPPRRHLVITNASDALLHSRGIA